ncbi:MAG: hypothetical protein HY700_05360 [Gemmatimonadetes bacterium]|nr:hypothetical protein [Gemmatimonadota bacterium]
MNAAWHRRHPMPPKATTEQRIAWHLQHAKQCGCREIPPTLAALMRKKKKKKG